MPFPHNRGHNTTKSPRFFTSVVSHYLLFLFSIFPFPAVNYHVPGSPLGIDERTIN
jgi:hypothetical protein